MSELGLDPDSDQDFEDEFKTMAADLMKSLEENDFGKAVTIVEALQETRNKSLFREIGRLTRALHDAIKNFQVDQNQENESNDSTDADASDRLAYVIDMTNKAANKTMDKVEEAMPIVEEMSAEVRSLNDEWSRFMNKEMGAEEFRDLALRIHRFLGSTDEQNKLVHSHLSDILMAQDYQDLTGQVIQKVTKMIKEVEGRLVNLVAMAGHVDKITGVTHDIIPSDENEEEQDPNRGEGPQINKEAPDVVSNQDDVDDLLSSLGF